MTPIRIEGRYNREEIDELLRAERSSAGWWAGFPFACILLSVFWLLNRDPKFGLICVIVANAGWLWYVWRHLKTRHEQAIQTMLKRATPINISLDADGLIYRGPHSTHQYSWAAFDDFYEERHLFALISKRSTILHIPKRLASPEQQTLLREHLSALFRIAQPQPQSSTQGFPVVIKGSSPDA